MPFRANNVSLRQPSDRLFRHLHELMGHHILGAVEAEAIDGGVGVGFEKCEQGISSVILRQKRFPPFYPEGRKRRRATSRI